jgi:hypothetical protein
MELDSPQQILDKAYHPIQTDASYDAKEIFPDAHVELDEDPFRCIGQVRARQFRMAFEMHSKYGN